MEDRPVTYEDLPTVIRDHIILQLRKAKLRATLVMQKYTRGRYPRLAYKRAVRNARTVRQKGLDPDHLRRYLRGLMPKWLETYRPRAMGLLPGDYDYSESTMDNALRRRHGRAIEASYESVGPAFYRIV